MKTVNTGHAKRLSTFRRPEKSDVQETYRNAEKYAAPYAATAQEYLQECCKVHGSQALLARLTGFHVANVLGGEDGNGACYPRRVVVQRSRRTARHVGLTLA